MEERDPATTNGPITPEERTYVIDILHTTRDALQQAIADLSDVQQQYKTTPDRWSITECVEHIYLVERGIFNATQAAMLTLAEPDRRTAIKVSDLFVIKAVRSRGVTTSSPTPFVPKGRFANVPSAMDAFAQQRAATLAFAETAAADMRLHFFEHPMLGTLDAYQTLLVIASHGERHRKQIEEIKASAGFPA
ncbi:DinB family protein [Fibrella sp. WM1]|uniref:DinB family protein n=1 Tax=Fibrella musci TaxID=3242485 RepID=UPI003520054A